MKHVLSFAVLLLLLSACGNPPSPPAVSPTPSVSAPPMVLAAPEALLIVNDGAAVRIQASCWDQDLTACPWRTGIGVLATEGAILRLQVVGAAPEQASVSWRPGTAAASASPTASVSALTSHIEPEAESVVLNALPPLPATLRFEIAWTIPGIASRSAVFFFRVLAPTTP